MLKGFAGALIFAFLTASSLYAQHEPLSLCIVQTKPDQATQYDPSAGPWAIAMYKQLSGQQLRNGAPLRITVLAASVEKDVLPEVRRLQCVWVVQLWYQQVITLAQVHGIPGPPWYQQVSTLAQGSGIPDGERLSGGSEDSLFFALRNAGTAKVIANGMTPLRVDSKAKPCAELAHKILKRLNQLR
jgi:hypothetical protein